MNWFRFKFVFLAILQFLIHFEMDFIINLIKGFTFFLFSILFSFYFSLSCKHNSDDLPSTSEQSRKNIWNILKQKRREERLRSHNRTILEKALGKVSQTKCRQKRRSKKCSKKRSKKKKKIVQKFVSKKNSFRNLAGRSNTSPNQENLNLIHRSCAKKNMDEDDDDCICIEPEIEEIVIDDVDNSDTELTSEYQNLLISFNRKVTSTPLQNRPQQVSTQTPQAKNLNLIECLENEALPFFEDIAGDLIFTPPIYKTLSVLTEDSKAKQSTESLKDREAKLINNNSIASPITIIDDSSLKDKRHDSTLKSREPSISEDDSVIFVSETNKNDFLPLKSKTGSNLIDAHVERTPRRTLLPELFTRSEKKQLSKYNTNAYNPSGDRENEQLSKKRMIIIDGSNVAYGHALCKNFSVRGLKIAIEYFEKMGHEVKAIVPQFRMSKHKSTEPDELERLHRAGKIVLTPCKNLPGKSSTCYDDRFILQLACELDAVVISNDNYRDLLFENTAFKKVIENRVIGYTWCNDIFILPKDPYGKWGPPLSSILNRV